MAYWALEALDGSKTALSSLDRVEGTDPPAFKLGRRPHEESHFGTLPICVSRNQAQLTPCHDGVAIRHSGSAPTGVLRHHGAFDSNEDVGQWVWLTQEMGSTVIRHGDTIAWGLTRGNRPPIWLGAGTLGSLHAWKSLNKTTLSHSTQARHRCELARARQTRILPNKNFTTKLPPNKKTESRYSSTTNPAVVGISAPGAAGRAALRKAAGLPLASSRPAAP